MTKPFDRASSIYKEIEVRVYGPLGSETPTCAGALTTAGLIAELENRVEALEAAQRPTVKDSLTVPADSLVGRVADGGPMKQQHPITPPPELVQKWYHEAHYTDAVCGWCCEQHIANRAAQWSADQELEAPRLKERSLKHLEAAAKPVESNAPESSDSLVELVADAIYGNAAFGVHRQARAAILAVSDWLYQQGWRVAAKRLRQEAQ
jgi:hypothetical protein